MNVQSLSEIRRMAEEISAREGCYLYDIEFVGAGQGRVLRVFIDKEADTGGASIDDCSNVSKGLNQLLDANEEVIPGGAYDLEVSTPGLERALKEPRHYERALGKKILVRTFAPLADFNEAHAQKLGKAKQVQGTLLAYDEQGLKVDQDGAEISVPFQTVTKAHLVFEFADPSDKKKGNKKK